MIDKETITAYNQTRETKDKTLLCHAPFTSVNFQQNGNANACCYNRSHVLGAFPAQTIKEIWFGEKADELRRYIRNNNLEGGCQMCHQQLLSHNFANLKAKFYDTYATFADTPIQKIINIIKLKNSIAYPKVLEFELSNTCNLECIMCSGHFSSSIRKNREKKSPLINPYNQDFVKQLEEFIPHLVEAKFLGGEPFLIDIYYEIWETIARINPKVIISITTNGTILNERALSLLNKLNCGIVMSIDSLQKDTYEKIRVNAKFEVVMQNFESLYNYTKKKNTFMSMAVCPIVENWKEIPDIVGFCNNKNIAIFFNTVFFPKEQTLRNYNSAKLEEIYLYYKTIIPETNTKIQQLNANCFHDLTNQIKAWFDEKLKFEKGERTERFLMVQKYLKEYSKNDIKTEIHNEELVQMIQEGFKSLKKNGSFTLEPYYFDFELEDFYPTITKNGHVEFLTHYLDAVVGIAKERLNPDELSILKNNFNIILQLTLVNPYSQKIVISLALMPLRDIIIFFSTKSEIEMKELFLEY